MTKIFKSAFVFIILFASTTALFSQSVLKEFTVYANKNITGPVQIVRNEVRKEWLVAFELSTPNVTNLFGRRVKSDGQFGDRVKMLGRGVADYGIAYSPVDRTYMLISRDQSTGSAAAQLFNETLARRGSPISIPNIRNAFEVNLAYQRIDNTFLVVWLELTISIPFPFVGAAQLPSLKSIILDSNGKTLTSTRELARSPSGSFLNRFTLSRNEARDRSLVIIREGTKLWGFHVKSTGELLRATPTVLQQGPVLAQRGPGVAAFSSDGTGFAVWARNAVPNDRFKLRKISAAGGTAGPAKEIARLQRLTPTVLFDSLHRQYFSAWLSLDNKLLGGIHNPATGSLKAKPFTIAEFASDSALLELSTSYDSQAGNVLVAWIEASSGGRVVRLRSALIKL